MATVLPYTGKEFLDSLDDGREVWIYGERVGDERWNEAGDYCGDAGRF